MAICNICFYYALLLLFSFSFILFSFIFYLSFFLDIPFVSLSKSHCDHCHTNTICLRLALLCFIRIAYVMCNNVNFIRKCGHEIICLCCSCLHIFLYLSDRPTRRSKFFPTKQFTIVQTKTLLFIIKYIMVITMIVSRIFSRTQIDNTHKFGKKIVY